MVRVRRQAGGMPLDCSAGDNAWNLKFQLNNGKYKDGTFLAKGSSAVKMLVGCDVCVWRGSDLCPHGLKAPEKHMNGYCTDYARFMRAAYLEAGTKTAAVQAANAVKLQLVEHELFKQFVARGKLPSDYVKVQSVLTKLTESMRRQEEGVRHEHEVKVSMEEFHKTALEQAKTIDADIVSDGTVEKVFHETAFEAPLEEGVDKPLDGVEEDEAVEEEGKMNDNFNS